MRSSVSYEPKGYIKMSNERLISYVFKGILGSILVIGLMFYYHHKIDMNMLLVEVAVFIISNLWGFAVKLNTKFCWSDNIFTILNFTGNPKKHFNWDDLKNVCINDSTTIMELIFNSTESTENKKIIRINTKDDGVYDLYKFIQFKIK